MILAIDIGGTFIKHGIYQSGKIIQSDKIPTTKESYKKMLADLVEIYESYSKEYEIKMIGVSSPGGVTETGDIVGITAMKWLEGNSLSKDISNIINLPVYILNDADALTMSALADYPKSKSALSIVIGTGIGSSLFLNGEIWRGANHNVEIGMMVDKQDSYKKGLSKKSIIEYVQVINKVLQTNMTGKEILSIYDEGIIAFINEQVTDFFETLAKTIVNAEVFINPEFIFLGGGITGWDKFLSEILKYRERIIVQSDEMPKLPTKIKVLEAKGDSQLIGASIYAERQNKKAKKHTKN